MSLSEIEWAPALIASALLLFGALVASNMIGRAATEAGLARLAVLGVGATALGAMIWTATITLDRLDTSPLAAARALLIVAAMAFAGLYLAFHAIDGATRRVRTAARAALALLAVSALLALALIGEAGDLSGAAGTMLRLALAAAVATLGLFFAWRRKRASHVAIAAIGLLACVALNPGGEPTRAPLADPSRIETQSIALERASESPTTAALAVGVLTALFCASFLAAQRGGWPFAAAVAVGRAKPWGDRAVVSRTPDARSVDSERRLAEALARAIDAREIDIEFQPQRRLSDGALLGGEALARWRRGSGAGARPDQFVRAAEMHGVIDALGAYVLREACRLATRWPATLHVAVNVSPYQLQNPRFETLLSDVLRETGLSPRRLELELTESALADDDAFDPAIVDRIRALGVTVSIDDFGRGQSSLARLQQIRVDQIKLDRSLVSEVEHSEAARTIVSAVISLAEKLGVQVLAEGVETRAQLGFHRDAGCSVVQGYLIGRPMAADAFPGAVPPWPLTP